MRLHFFALALVAALAVPSVALAQPALGEDLGEFYSYGDRYFIEFVTLPSTTPGKTRTVVPFRLA
jgi:hypothetical protein